MKQSKTVAAVAAGVVFFDATHPPDENTMKHIDQDGPMRPIELVRLTVANVTSSAMVYTSFSWPPQ